jgi:uncharacterized membrane protein YccC
MISLNTRAKEAIKTGLAVVIAYAIALELGWEKPLWAAFAVVLISLDTTGQSLNKAAMRILGTLVGGAAAFLLLALFPQQRWLMMFGLSVYYGVCVYIMTGSKRPYFWFVCAFVCMVVMVDAAPADSLRIFQIVAARVEETAMGILVYSLISVLLWPRSSRVDLYEVGRKLSETQHQLYQTYRGLMAGHGTAEASQPLRMQELQLLTRLGKALGAAELDSYEVFEVRHQWRRFHEISAALMETLEHWRRSFPEIQSLDLERLLPNLTDVRSELDDRFAQIHRMLTDEAPTRKPTTVDLMVEQTEILTHTHFQRAALTVAKAQIDRLETLSRSLFGCVQDIKGYAREDAKPSSEKVHRRPFTVDPERFTSVIRVMAAQWIGFLIWICVDPPGHALFVFFVTLWTMIAVMGHINPLMLWPGFVFGLVLGGVVYIFIMPHLSGYLQLGLMLFIVTFAGFYILPGAIKIGAMAFFHVVIGIQNQQTYNFAGYANTAAAIVLSLACVVALFYIFSSPRPEKVFLRRLNRFFRQAEFLLSRLALDRDEQKGLATRWRMAIYSNNLLELPDKLAALVPRIDYRLLPGQTAEQVQAVANRLQAIAYRIKDLVDARNAPQNDLLVAAVIEDVRAWRMLAQKQFRLWTEDPAQAVEPGVGIQDRLTARIKRLEEKIGVSLRSIEEGQLSEKDYENFYRFLGAFRGLSESGIAFERDAQGIDWAMWKEARF